MKILNGKFIWNEVIEIEIDGKIIKRKVHYDILNGLYVIIDGEKVGERAFEKNEDKIQ